MESNRKYGKPLVIIQTYQDRMNNLANKDLTQKVTERLQASATAKEAPQQVYEEKSSDSQQQGPPPPPPPLPSNDQQYPERRSAPTVTNAKPKQKAPPPPVPIKTSTLSYLQPPPCPTPDYDTLSLNSNSTLPRNSGTVKKNNASHHHHHNGDSVEMESLDSFRIHNPNTGSPKPPQIYFQAHQQLLKEENTNGKTPRPVSVTIGEYNGRKMPTKFDFLHTASASSSGDSECSENLNEQFASELAQTLSRSNLRRRTESLENLLDNSQISQSNGSVRISVNNVSKQNLHNITKALENNSNRVTINIPSENRKLEMPSGILKNSANGNQQQHSLHRPLVHQKSITFGEMPTVIKDHPLHVT